MVSVLRAGGHWQSSQQSTRVVMPTRSSHRQTLPAMMAKLRMTNSQDFVGDRSGRERRDIQDPLRVPEMLCITAGTT